ncbi:MAG: hypothetical protein C4523_11175 [Myxococcales bacterium]|nr:MAG: hypothetical protein C4523_11175 [Myxococcales bacterium]
MTSMASKILTALLFTAVFAGCVGGGPLEAAKGLTSLRLSLESETGAPDAPLTIGEGLAVQVRVEALDEQGQPMPGYRGKVRFSSKSVFLGRNGWEAYDVAHGDSISLELVRGMGRTRIMAEDEEKFVVGVTEVLYLPPVNFQVAQTPVGSVDAAPWRNNFIRFESGTMVVTHASIDGFYATDLLGDAYNHLYVYTHSMAAVDRGDVLRFVSGTLDEFYGLTELSFPDYEVLCNRLPLPDPVPLTAAMLADDNEMEKYEAGLVSVEGVQVANVDTASYYSYGQWTGQTADGGRITLTTTSALPDFDPRESRNVTLTRVVGNLRQHYSADPEWIVAPRDACDVWGLGERPADCDAPAPETNCRILNDK